MELLDINKKFWNKSYEHLYTDEFFGKGVKYSEHGEENIIDAVFSNCSYNKYFVDVGAYGQRSSNTWKLMDDGWSGIMMDNNKIQTIEICQFVTQKVRALWTKVGIDDLDTILLSHAVPYDFAFLSLDIDSYEYEVWKNLQCFKPSLVCIECNTMENDFNVIGYDPSFSLYKYTGKPPGYGGATIGLLNKLAEEKGYDYLCWDVSNVFYIKKGVLNRAN